MQQGMQNMAKAGANNPMPGITGSPASSDPSFNSGAQLGQFAGPGNRMGQNNKPMGMMPPPSPGMSGPPKDQSAANKDKPNPTNGHPEGSPRNAAQQSGQVQGQGTPNPGPLGQGATAPPTPAPTSNMTAPSPSSVLSNPSTTPMNPPGPPPPSVDALANVFSTDFIQSVASSLDEFDPSVFSSERDLNFERDFGQWFNPDDVGALDMK
jgi:hypothetical protein